MSCQVEYSSVRHCAASLLSAHEASDITSSASATSSVPERLLSWAYGVSPSLVGSLPKTDCSGSPAGDHLAKDAHEAAGIGVVVRTVQP